MNEIYYRTKIINLIDHIFVDTGDAKSRIRNCEDKIFNACMASKSKEVPIEVKDRWEKIWYELNYREDWYDKGGRLIQTSLNASLKRRHNKTMKAYLQFFLEEFYRVI